ncbi:MAG: alpha/beta hydrolase-fold protein, partial [Bacteroidota bacterium]
LLQSQSVIESHTFFSSALGIDKTYLVYLPDGYHDNTTQHYPVVYFLRNHETEWFNRGYRTNYEALQDVANNLFDTGQIGKMILILINTGGDNLSHGHLGAINMLRPDLITCSGIGTGTFEDYFIQDVIPHIDSNFRTLPTRCMRGIDGFSMGGYISTLFAMKYPELFYSVGSYDGSIMFYNLDDPDIPGTLDDYLWLHSDFNYYIDPMFDNPRDIPYMLLNSATDILVNASNETLDIIREISFHIHSTASDEPESNYDSNQQFLDSLAERNIYNTFNELELNPDAIHDFNWADVHASESLVKHWEVFLTSMDINDEPNTTQSVKLSQNFPNPFNSTTTIAFMLPKQSSVKLRLFNSYGATVKVLVDKTLLSGKHHVQLDAENYPPGMYYYQLEVEGQTQTKRLLIVK